MSKAINLSTIITILVIFAAAAASLEVQVKLTESPELLGQRFSNVKAILKSAQDEIHSASMRIAFENLDDDNFEDTYREEIMRILGDKVGKINVQMFKDLSDLKLVDVLDYLLNFFTELTLTSRLFGSANLNLKALLDSLTIHLALKFDQVGELQRLKTQDVDYLKPRLAKFLLELDELNSQNQLTGPLLDKNLEIAEEVLELVKQTTPEEDFDRFLDELLAKIGHDDNDLLNALRRMIANKRKPSIEIEGDNSVVLDKEETDPQEEEDLVRDLDEVEEEEDLVGELDDFYSKIGDSEEPVEEDPIKKQEKPMNNNKYAEIQSMLKKPTDIRRTQSFKAIEKESMVKPNTNTKPAQFNRHSYLNTPSISKMRPSTKAPASVNPVLRNSIVSDRKSVVSHLPNMLNKKKADQPNPSKRVSTMETVTNLGKTTVPPSLPKEKKHDELVPDIVLEDIFANADYISQTEGEIINNLINIESDLNMPFEEMPSFDAEIQIEHLNNPEVLHEFLKSKDFSCLKTKYYFSHNIVTFYMKSLIFRNSLFNEEIATQIRELKFKKESTTAPRVFGFIKEQLWNRFEASIILNFKAKAMDHGLDHPHNFNLLREEAYRYVNKCLLPKIKEIFERKMVEFQQHETYKKIAKPELADKVAKKYYADHFRTVVDGFLEFLIPHNVPDMAKFIEEFVIMQTSKRYSQPANWQKLFDDIKDYVIANKVESREIDMVKSRIEVFKIVKAALEKRRQIFYQQVE